jgi:uncharacterized membrane protein
MSPRSYAVPIILALLILIAGAPAVAQMATPSQAGDDRVPAQLARDSMEPNQTIDVAIQPNGDARWHVTIALPIRDENETAAFEDLAASFESGDTDLLRVETFERAAVAASETTGREMSIEDTNRNATLANATGELTLSFTWTNFGREDGETLRVGDAFRTGDGLWLDELDERQTLVVHAPSGYGVTNANWPVENGTIRIEGPTTFDREALAITYQGDGPANAGETTGAAPPTSGPPGLGSSMVVPVAVISVVLVVLGVYALSREGVLPGGETTEAERESDSPAETDPRPAEAQSAATETATETTAAATESDATADGTVDTELLSDEERVERLLEQNGGRMKQANIVKETGWSNAKVSQLLSAMDEDGQIEKLRIGRENLISFPDKDVEDP